MDTNYTFYVSTLLTLHVDTRYTFAEVQITDFSVRILMTSLSTDDEFYASIPAIVYTHIFVPIRCLIFKKFSVGFVH